MNKYKLFISNPPEIIEADDFIYDPELKAIDFYKDEVLVAHIPYDTSFILLQNEE